MIETIHKHALLSFPMSVRKLLEATHSSPTFDGVINAAEARSLAESLSFSLPQLMTSLVPVAAGYSRPEISGYPVGGVGLGMSGNLYYGANLEFPGGTLSETLHAEQSVILNAWLHAEQGLTALALPAPPCGHCRQFLYEIDNSLNLVVSIRDRSPSLLSELLPVPFGPRELGITSALMKPQSHRLSLAVPSDDPVTLTALAAANACYAPYTRGYAGAAILTRDGRVFIGRYCENAAYNPTTNPIICALSQMLLARLDYSQIARVVLVQASPSKSSQVELSRRIIKRCSTAEVEAHFCESVA